MHSQVSELIGKSNTSFVRSIVEQYHFICYGRVIRSTMLQEGQFVTVEGVTRVNRAPVVYNNVEVIALGNKGMSLTFDLGFGDKVLLVAAKDSPRTIKDWFTHILGSYSPETIKAIPITATNNSNSRVVFSRSGEIDYAMSDLVGDGSMYGVEGNIGSDGSFYHLTRHIGSALKGVVKSFCYFARTGSVGLKFFEIGTAPATPENAKFRHEFLLNNKDDETTEHFKYTQLNDDKSTRMQLIDKVDGSVNYQINSTTGSPLVTVAITPEGALSITATGNIALNPGDNLTLNVTGDLTLEASGNVSLTATDLVTISGGDIKLDGTMAQKTGLPGQVGCFNGIPACLFTGAPHASVGTTQ
jgi:hypothetical protein